MRYQDRFDIARKGAGVEWPSNAARHSFASYHLALQRDAAKTSLQLGLTNTAVLFQHYRELARPEDVEAYFAITPMTATPMNVMGGRRSLSPSEDLISMSTLDFEDFTPAGTLRKIVAIVSPRIALHTLTCNKKTVS